MASATIRVPPLTRGKALTWESAVSTKVSKDCEDHKAKPLLHTRTNRYTHVSLWWQTIDRSADKAATVTFRLLVCRWFDHCSRESWWFNCCFHHRIYKKIIWRFGPSKWLRSFYLTVLLILVSVQESHTCTHRRAHTIDHALQGLQ